MSLTEQFPSIRLLAIVAITCSWACSGGSGTADEPSADAGAESSADAALECGEQSPNGPCEICPPNSTPTPGSDPQRCTCDEGFAFDASGAQCQPIESDSCPPNSSPSSENGQEGCRCDEGYVVNAAGNACVLPADACPANSSYVEENGQSGCRCDEGYQANAAGNACEALPATCPEGNPKATVNGVVVLCCPANAVGVQLSAGAWSCVCAEGESYEALSNQCL